MTAYTSTFKACSWNLQIINIDALSQTVTWTCAWHVWFAASTPFVGAPSWASAADQVNAWFRDGDRSGALVVLYYQQRSNHILLNLESLVWAQKLWAKSWLGDLLSWCDASLHCSSGVIVLFLITFLNMNSVTRASSKVEASRMLYNLKMKRSQSLTVASVRGSLPSCEGSSVLSRKIGNAFRFVWPANYEVVSDPVSAWKGINASAVSGLNSQDVMSSFTWMYFGFLLVPAFIYIYIYIYLLVDRGRVQ